MNNDMGKVTARIRVENWFDSELVRAGVRKEKPRYVETEALVDTGAVKFYLKSSVIKELGLHPVGEVKSRTMSNRSEVRTVFSPVALEIQGRTGRFDVVEVPDSLPTLLARFRWKIWIGSWIAEIKNSFRILSTRMANSQMSFSAYLPLLQFAKKFGPDYQSGPIRCKRVLTLS